TVKSGGIPHDSFRFKDNAGKKISFETFIREQFSDGVTVNTTKSIYNNQGTISIYPSKTELEVGSGYRIRANGKNYAKQKEEMFQQIRQQADQFADDFLYIESTLGTFSLSDLYPFTHEVKQKEPL